jgi:hypothetical protein
LPRKSFALIDVNLLPSQLLLILNYKSSFYKIYQSHQQPTEY